jgi:hypothetical protein
MSSEERQFRANVKHLEQQISEAAEERRASFIEGSVKLLLVAVAGWGVWMVFQILA